VTSAPLPVYVAAGSNVEPRRHLARALGLLRGQFPDLVASRAYANTAVGFAGEDFINLVVGFHTTLTLAELLNHLHSIEEACGRARLAPKWEPRSMDLDVLLYGDLVGDFPGAKLPRADLVKRAFMLGPLAEIAADVRHPTDGRTIGELWAAFDRDAHPLRPVDLDA
jgi:2-amino-4-hydroxy-6-hydroxymethyldihydropteridine diphosphokinase